jgi:outer membrane immunogenic protein
VLTRWSASVANIALGVGEFGDLAMRKLIVASIGLLMQAALQPAAAADVAPAPYYSPYYRPAVVIFTWTGFYFGAHGGGGWASKDASATQFNVAGVPVIPAAVSIDANGWLAGGQIGANYQVGSWVFGVEVDASGANLTGNSTCTSSALGVAFTSNCQAKVDGVGTLAGRLGFAVDRALVYGKGGLAWADDSYVLNSTTLSFNGNESRWGWMVGAGFEYSFTDNWSWKIEYNYLDFGTRAVGFTDTTGLFNFTTNIRERINLVKAGVNYRWGWAPVGVVY